MLQIGSLSLQNNLIAAPLAGIANPVYRLQMHRYGAGLVVSEMISDKALHYQNQRTFDMCRTVPGEHPVALQLFGGDPETMAEAAEYLSSHTDCDVIDINMGCPVHKVIKAGAGCSLMQDPERAEAVARAVVTHTDRPVTVKMRAGWDEEHITCADLARRLEQAGVAAVTVHGRTRGQFYEGHCHLEWIRQVREAVTIPVIGNGDITTVAAADTMLAETGCDGLMIGRGLLGRPFFLQELQAHFAGTPYTPPDEQARLALCLQYAEDLCAYEGEKQGMLMMRSLGPWYLKGLPGSAAVRGRLSQITHLADLQALLQEYGEKLSGNSGK